MGVVIRPMAGEDLAAVHALQCQAHPDCYHEPPDALASRLRLGPDFCFVAEAPGQLLAYFLAHPWAGDPPALHEGLPRALRVPAQHLFLHDLAVRPESRGLALGRQLYAAIRGRAAHHGFVELRLVAIGSASAYWAKLGFTEFDGRKLHPSYGDAVLMCGTSAEISD